MHRALPALLVLLALTAGCVASNGPATPSETPPEPTQTVGPTPTTGPTPTASPTASVPEVPKAPDDCAVGSLPNGTYPALPGDLSESSATAFALDFEKAYGWGDLAGDSDVDVSGFDGWKTEDVRRVDAGYVAKATVRLDFVDQSYETENGDVLAGSANSRGWYYVTEGFAARAPASSETVPGTEWETIACE